MGSFHVFIERARDPAVTADVAAAIAARYGMPADAIAMRMARGRFRVKGNVDLDTARRFASDLERLGAVCAIVGSDGEPAPPARASSQGMQSGLAAAFSGEGADQDLGILGDDSGALALSTVDGEEEPPPEPRASSFAPEEAAGGARDDLFAPPDASERDLELAVELHTPPPEVISAPESAPDDGGDDVLTLMPESQPAGESPVVRARRAVAGDRRINLAAGVFLALFLGFLPAHIISSLREDSAYAAIDEEVREAQAQVRDVDDWVALDELRAEQRELKDAKRSNIAVGGMIIWAACSGGLGFVWFRLLDWDRWT